MTRKLVTIKFGSHLYGISTPTSDVDFKSVHVPAPRDLLLQRAKGSISTARVKQEKEKNLPGEVEEESYSLQRYLQLAAEGQTVALDMLFAPEWSMTGPPSPEWREVQANRDRLITKKSAAFLRYCRQQANKYGIKGSRVAAARRALDILNEGVEQLGTQARLERLDYWIGLEALRTEHTSIDEIPQAAGGAVKHWNVCGRKLQYTATIKHARDVVKALVDEYGQRALQAESQQGVDWKALSHAVRVGHQAIELLSTGRVTFPLPNAEHVLAIKAAKHPYQEVAAEIEHLLEAVENAAVQSSLPQEPDLAWIEAFVLRVYGREVAPIGAIERARIFGVAAHAAVKQLRKYTNEAYSVRSGRGGRDRRIGSAYDGNGRRGLSSRRRRGHRRHDRSDPRRVRRGGRRTGRMADRHLETDRRQPRDAQGHRPGALRQGAQGGADRQTRRHPRQFVDDRGARSRLRPRLPAREATAARGDDRRRSDPDEAGAGGALMALPTTAVQIEMMMGKFDADLLAWRERFQAMINGVFGIRAVLRPFEPRHRPHTDDMMQMLADLGVEPPERQPPRLDDLTFVWPR